jgi:hypothetical protein
VEWSGVGGEVIFLCNSSEQAQIHINILSNKL